MDTKASERRQVYSQTCILQQIVPAGRQVCKTYKRQLLRNIKRPRILQLTFLPFAVYDMKKIGFDWRKRIWQQILVSSD